MRLRSDTDAASPLVVIATFVLSAVALTALVYFLAFDRPEPRLQVIESGAGGFDVTHAGGGLQWDEVKLRFIDAAGTDQAGHFLVPPSGDVDEGDHIGYTRQPPAGHYLLVILKGGTELSRLAVEV